MIDGAKIAEKLTLEGWQQSYLSAKTGIPRPHLNQIIRGHVPNPRYETVLKIADALNCEPRDLTKI